MSDDDVCDVRTVDDDGRTVERLGRADITTGVTELPVKVYRVARPPIFAGFQVPWVDGDDGEGATFAVAAGAGFGSKYMTLKVEVPGHDAVYEYVDITELVKDRVGAIIAEVRS